MSDWIAQFLVALRRANLDLSADDVADIIWLAPQRSMSLRTSTVEP